MSKICVIKCTSFEVFGMPETKVFSTWAKANKWLAQFLEFNDFKKIVLDQTEKYSDKLRCREICVIGSMFERPILARYTIREQNVDDNGLYF